MAFGLLFDLIREQNRSGKPGVRIWELLREIDTFVQFISFGVVGLEKEIEDQIQLRQQLRRERRFAEADEIRDSLLADGIVLEDTPAGVRWKVSR